MIKIASNLEERNNMFVDIFELDEEHYAVYLGTMKHKKKWFVEETYYGNIWSIVRNKLDNEDAYKDACSIMVEAIKRNIDSLKYDMGLYEDDTDKIKRINKQLSYYEHLEYIFGLASIKKEEDNNMHKMRKINWR